MNSDYPPARKAAVFLVVAILAMISIGLGRLIGAAKPKTATASVSSPYEVTLPVVMRNVDSTLGTPIFGVQMYGSTNSDSPYHPFLVDSGASWVRVPVHWSEVQPTSTITVGTMIWTSIDNKLGAAQEDMGGLNVIATFDSAPDWALITPGKPFGPIKSERLPDFAAFVAAAVERYDGDSIDDVTGSPVVKYWEFYNEPDQGDGNSWGDDGDKYAQMLAAVYPAVKAANSEAQVVFGGVAYDNFEPVGKFVPEFLDDVFSSGGGDHFDVMNFHYYPVFHANWLPPGGEGPGLLEKAQAIRSKLGQYGLRNKPMIVTEAGWHSNEEAVGLGVPGSPEIQARYVIELFTQSFAADLDVMIWWMLYDPGIFYPENGLVTDEITPTKKLSFDVYKALVAELSTAHFDRILTPAETGVSNMEAYKFNDYTYNRSVYVAWLDPVDSTAIRTLNLPGNSATVRNYLGQDVAYIAGNGGIVSIQVTARPIYVEISN